MIRWFYLAALLFTGFLFVGAHSVPVKASPDEPVKDHGIILPDHVAFHAQDGRYFGELVWEGVGSSFFVIPPDVCGEAI